MKVGTDGVLLGAWATPPIGATNTLDIGTGSGLIALMLAQRFEDLTIDAVEIDEPSSLQATDNFISSPWSDRITMYNSSIQDFVSDLGIKKYEHIVSNPPYFTNSLKCSDKKRTTARHNDSLSLESLLDCSSRVLSSDGMLSLILPIQEGLELIELSGIYGFKVAKVCRVFPTTLSKEPKRLLIELCLTTRIVECQDSCLIIERETRFDYTQEYVDLTKDFYLKF